jgi:pyrroloquinoline quinone (PQQ) biosynthesis protein C
LLNEIVLDAESDQASGGGYLSHFELYLRAMQEGGASVTPIQIFVNNLRAGLPMEEALETSATPQGVKAFVQTTMAIARSTEPHCVAAAFAYGREEIIPAMFRRVVNRLAKLSPRRWETFRYYLDRHIRTDADHHGSQSRLLVRKLCGSDNTRWSKTTVAARTSLEARDKL